MSNEDLELLQAVREWTPPAHLHPIAMFATHKYEDLGKMSMSPEVVQELRDTLESYGEDLASLAEAMEGLVRFMLMLADHVKDEEGSKKVADLLREFAPRFEPFWDRVGEALDNVGVEAREAFLEFTGTEGEKTAASVEDKAPDGSLPLKRMVDPGRPPPWMKHLQKKTDESKKPDSKKKKKKK